jgi:hypothetical protein
MKIGPKNPVPFSFFPTVLVLAGQNENRRKRDSKYRIRDRKRFMAFPGRFLDIPFSVEKIPYAKTGYEFGLAPPPAAKSTAGPPLAPAAISSPMLLLGGGRAEREGSLLCHTPIRQSTHATQRRSKMVLSFARSGG